MHEIDLLASNNTHERIVSIQVKTKTAGTWQTSTLRGKKRSAPKEVETKFWVFVDLGHAHPVFYIVPTWWIENNIHNAHNKYLAEHGGHRAKTDSSTHHAIPVSRIEQRRDAWETLGIFPLHS